MALQGLEVAVVGGGIGGLAAAAALARRGARVQVFEAAPALAEAGAGLQVSPNGVAVLAALGLADAAAAVASTPAAIELCDLRSGRRVARIGLGAEAAGRYGRPYWQFHRADLLALLAGAAAEAGAEIRTGARVRPAGDPAAPRVAAPGGERGFDVVVAADGVRSDARTRWFGGQAPRFTGHVAWRGLVSSERLSPWPELTRVHMAPGRHLVTYPLRGGSLVNFVAVEERAAWAEEGWSHPGDPAGLRRAFRGGSPAVQALLAAVDATFVWGLFDHPRLARWSAGRTALLGDACHPMLPFLAQGATMALEDAWTLAETLDAHEAPEAGLAAYAARRQPRAGRVQAAAARNGRLYHLGAALRPPVNLGLAAAARLAPGFLLSRFDWLFGADVTRASAGPPAKPTARPTARPTQAP